ncbi:GreA/GreB family elongation factor [bacterium]|nr:GreA/GreB family elongation factor [bacterium]
MNITGFKTLQNDKYTDNNNDQEYNKDMDLITQNGRTDLENKIIVLNKKKPIIAEQLSAARENGGIEENEELHMSLDEMNRVDIEIARLEAIIQNSRLLIIPSPGNYDKVAPGLTVQLENFFVDKIVTYTILGESESDPSNGSISFKSPLGRELLGLGVGDVAELIRGDDVIEYEVLKIYTK